MLNHVVLMGNLVADPEVRYTKTHAPYVRYTLAVGRSGGTDYIYICAWGALAEAARRKLKKGMQVTVSGQLRQRLWEDRHGIAHSLIEVYAGEQYFAERSAPAAQGSDCAYGAIPTV